MKKAEREHMAKVKEMSCIICGDYPGEVHHTGTAMGVRKNHMRVLPLCFDHHRGQNGIGTVGRKIWEFASGTEEELLAKLEGGI